MKLTTLALSLALAGAIVNPAAAQALRKQPFSWDNATVYFLLTDRFNNGNPANDHAYGRKDDAAPLRGFMGGDIAGVTAKIREGYFRDLGVDAIWITPPVEQIHGSTDEGTGKSYGFHGYWARDFTAVDANLGTEADVRELVDTAHANGIRVLLDVVMNHTGPVTKEDPVWPQEWVRTGPNCTYKDVATTIDCTLVTNLPDFRTGGNAAVKLPPALVAKWKAEGRYEREVKELDAFFRRTGYPRAPRYYLMKWHADWVRKYGFDGFRADTVKHVEPGVWKELKKVASAAYEDWKRANPAKRLGDDKFYMTAEVYNYSIAHGHRFDLGGGVNVDYFANGFDSLINFSAKADAQKDIETMFSSYSQALNGPLSGRSVLNYMSSHDDSMPFDALRTRPFDTANRLLLAPGAAQIYYGDETARVLKADGAEGDANLRSFMNWDELAKNAQRGAWRIGEVRAHWAKLGMFRQAHIAVGAGVHQMIQSAPYVFKRTYDKDGVRDQVVVALGLPTDKPASIPVRGVFNDGQTVRDAYSGTSAVVAGGVVQFPVKSAVALISY
ncbi:alpha-amylase family glycosyl hydrolase [Massilia sp. R2A-15]|uniref:alpha-amylase family glycosyl hydrolase n=1 Tax=Massilia sp. R2A-15 TaxID=3064278 RepID=UPI002734C6B4|nr:alpha-amylase family glycosyl hydrolase [Massilia sp. R2A-15]WLI88171.1 alpha-amylase family glycosyl hydrolase [Massilia sp. R2A-15]